MVLDYANCLYLLKATTEYENRKQTVIILTAIPSQFWCWTRFSMSEYVFYLMQKSVYTVCYG